MIDSSKRTTTTTTAVVVGESEFAKGNLSNAQDDMRSPPDDERERIVTSVAKPRQVLAQHLKPITKKTTSFDESTKHNGCDVDEKDEDEIATQKRPDRATQTSDLILMNPSELGATGVGGEQRENGSTRNGTRNQHVSEKQGQEQTKGREQNKIFGDQIRDKEKAGGCEQVDPDEQAIRPSRKRYFILLMFVVLHVVKSFQWICLASITNVVAKFYQVDNLAVNWTTILFMVTFLVLALPVSWIMDSLGLRRSVLVGTLGVTLGVTIKCFTCHRAGFPLSMFGHLIVGVTEPFFFSSYAQLASVWFPDNQVALATAASIIGEQTGLALGFIIPPLVIGRDPNDFEAVQRGLFYLFLTVAIIAIANSISIILFFDEEPRFAPGIARFKQKRDETIRRQSQQTSWLQQTELDLVTKSRKISNAPMGAAAAANGKRKQSLRRASTISRVSQSVGEQAKLSARLMGNRHFILLLIGFGINIGIAYSIHTLLNQMIVPKDEAPISTAVSEFAVLQANSTREMELLEKQQTPSEWTGAEANLIVGNAGLILILSGLVGSAVCGYILDRYHRYKLTTVLVYLLTLVAMAALASSLLLESATILYLAIIPLGFAQTGYASCAFDFGVELTYPKPELLSSTLLNMSAQIFGIPISLAGSLIVDTYGSQALGAFFCSALALGFVVTCLQGGELRRQTAVNERSDLKVPVGDCNKLTATMLSNCILGAPTAMQQKKQKQIQA